MSILVVEDNAIAARVISGILHKNGFDVIAAGTVQAGIEQLQREDTVTAAIVDIVLADQEGFELVDWIRSSLRWSYLPVVICSASRDPGKVGKLAGLGCRHYVLKPISESEILGKLKTALDSGPLLTELRAAAMNRLGLDIKAYQDIANLYLAHAHGTHSGHRR